MESVTIASSGNRCTLGRFLEIEVSLVKKFESSRQPFPNACEHKQAYVIHLLRPAPSNQECCNCNKHSRGGVGCWALVTSEQQTRMHDLPLPCLMPSNFCGLSLEHAFAIF